MDRSDGNENSPVRPLIWYAATSEEVSYIVSMAPTEHTLTFLLRSSGDVLAEVAHGDVVLRRRDGEDLFLGLRSREESLRDTLGVLARLLASAGNSSNSSSDASALTDSLPWTAFLPSEERNEFLGALRSTAAACADLDDFEPLARLVDGWRAAAEVHANPQLAKLLKSRPTGPTVGIKRPKAS